MKTYLWIAIFSSIAMLFSGISVLLNNDPTPLWALSVIGFGFFSVAAGLNWTTYFSKSTRDAEKEKRRKQYEKLKEEFDERD
jgi:threonine/homoserine efflux transporter RhtA